MDAFRVRRKDTVNGGPPLRILSLDGGGVRGYSMLIIIQELMHRTFVETQGRAPRRHEIPKPCDHFDLIVGTGTGGLIAIMLGRLRLDLEMCKELYVRMTRIVFQTDKTIAGIPYRSTLFKASKLEDAIRQAVREHTTNDEEGDDGDTSEPATPPYLSRRFTGSGPQRHPSIASVVSFSARPPAVHAASRPVYRSGMGNGEAMLYDSRENATKTAVTAMYQGSTRHAAPVILRSYDSRREPPPDFDCRIWEAGRATCAIGLAFKPISIGGTVFHDDGAGTFNPAPEALDEAVVNEWPGREVGVFVSLGTGKRPRSSDHNQQVWSEGLEGFLGEFAEARRRLNAKIDGCERIHEYMQREHLSRRGVNPESYFRLNVEIGVGDYGMNEWNRLGDISTSTRRYMVREEEQRMIHGISSRLARVHRARQRLSSLPVDGGDASDVKKMIRPSTSFDVSFAVELPGDMPSAFPPSPRASFESNMTDKISIGPHDPRLSSFSSPRSSHDHVRPGSVPYSPGHKVLSSQQPQQGLPPPLPPRGYQINSDDAGQGRRRSSAGTTAPLTPAMSNYGWESEKIVVVSSEECRRQQPQQQQPPPPKYHISAARVSSGPPVPPKTPLRMSGGAPPYPIDDEEERPPAVNMARKPVYRG